MKIINLKGFMKSEFDEDVDYSKVFEHFKLSMGRMISSSKSGYRERYPDNLVIFNANIITEKGGKVWYGDLDITRDFDVLKEIADELQEDLYILRELDARFGNENETFASLKKKAAEIIRCAPSK